MYTGVYIKYTPVVYALPIFQTEQLAPSIWPSELSAHIYLSSDHIIEYVCMYLCPLNFKEM
jgi:hypothetical protein